MENAQKVYEFLGLSFAHETREWITKNTGQGQRKLHNGHAELNTRHRRALNLADFHLTEKIEYDDKGIEFS